MPIIFMPRKTALIMLLVLGAMCLVDGIIKKDIKEILVGLGILAYAVVSLINGKKKNAPNKIEQKDSNFVNPNR
jgi:hypothetical protein